MSQSAYACQETVQHDTPVDMKLALVLGLLGVGMGGCASAPKLVEHPTGGIPGQFNLANSTNLATAAGCFDSSSCAEVCLKSPDPTSLSCHLARCFSAKARADNGAIWGATLSGTATATTGTTAVYTGLSGGLGSKEIPGVIIATGGAGILAAISAGLIIMSKIGSGSYDDNGCSSLMK